MIDRTDREDAAIFDRHVRVRHSFARVPDALPVPDLLAEERASFAWFLGDGLREALLGVTPIVDPRGRMEVRLSFPDGSVGTPRHTITECLERDLTFAAPISVRAALHVVETGEIVEKTLPLAETPLMTDEGTFVVNGSERVVIAQIVRAPGVYLTRAVDGGSGRPLYGARIIPSRGSHLTFETNRAGVLSVKIDRARAVPATALLRVLLAGLSARPVSDDELVALFADVDTHPDRPLIPTTLAREHNGDTFAAARLICRRLKPSDNLPKDRTIPTVLDLFGAQRYDLAPAGRYTMNRRLGLAGAEGRTLQPQDVIAALRLIAGAHAAAAAGDGPPADVVDDLCNQRVRGAGELVAGQFRVGLLRLARATRERMTLVEATAVTPKDIVVAKPAQVALRTFFAQSQFSQFKNETNPLAALRQKRTMTALGPGGLARDRAGAETRDVHPSHYGREDPLETPEGQSIGLIKRRPIFARLDAHGFIEAPYRVVSRSLGSHDVRLVGRTLAADLALPGAGGATVTTGSVVSDAHAVALRGGAPMAVPVLPFVTDEVVYIGPDGEGDYVIAQASTPRGGDGTLVSGTVPARHRGDYVETTTARVDLLDASPRQIFSPTTAVIPFGEHDDGHRLLMGANQGTQAVPLREPQAPLVGSGMEAEVARKGGMVPVARAAGVVMAATKRAVRVRRDDGEEDSYPLRTFARTNQGTTLNERPLVRRGDRIATGDPLADTGATAGAELALGRNVLVAYMAWEGANFEDGVVIGEHVVREGAYASIHSDIYHVDVYDTPAGPEERTRDIPGADTEHLRKLDEHGLIKIGTTVREGMVLVGKVEPVVDDARTPEERLFAAVFGGAGARVRDTSLTLKGGRWGRVTGVRVLSRAPAAELPPDRPGVIFRHGDNLPADVRERVEVTLAQTRNLVEGDKMAGRHGNKGVVSRIVPRGDMPFLPDGTPVDIVLNALGVPSRMNIGQVLETHLGWAAAELGMHVASPAFDGATEGDIRDLLRRAGLPENGKTILYDGRTGEPFDQDVTVGVAYMLKLHHLVEDKMHARSTGPYTMVTRQPVGGKAKRGGQRFGEMELWAMEAYGAAHLLLEALTVKSDDEEGRRRIWDGIVAGKPRLSAGAPAAFWGMVREIRALGIDVEVGPDRAWVRARLASPATIRSWSGGEVTRADTVEVGTLAPLKDGLFCPTIFGPADDWTCPCGTTTGRRKQGRACPSCGKPVAYSTHRRERMGHIELAAPCAHIAYTKGKVSRIALLLGVTPRQLEATIYGGALIVTCVDEEARRRALADGAGAAGAAGAARKALSGLRVGSTVPQDEAARVLEIAHGSVAFEGGAAGVRTILEGLDVGAVAARLRAEMDAAATAADETGWSRASARLVAVEQLRRGGVRPEWLVLTTLPVLPPGLRPIVPMDGGRVGVADQTELYRKVIYRNKRLRELRDNGAPAPMLRHEARLLQNAVDALLANGVHGKPSLGRNGMPLRSLSDTLKGKPGRFRQHLLAKRVDFSGRSVIVPNPDLRLHQCGLPKRLALELYRPFVMRRLAVTGAAPNLLAARRMIDKRHPAVWDALAAATRDRPVILNRSPSLHRLSMRAFEVALVEGSAIHIHPLACAGFNADFDGDQMAVHLPLSDEARLEALTLMLASRNLLSPGDGEPAVSPSKDMVMGCYYLTAHLPGEAAAHDVSRGRAPGPAAPWPRDDEAVFGDWGEAVRAAEAGLVGLHTMVWVAMDRRALDGPAAGGAALVDTPVGAVPRDDIRPIPGRPRARGYRTTPGRILFNMGLPPEVPFVDKVQGKGAVKKTLVQVYAACGPARTALVVDRVMRLGFTFVTRSGISMAIGDVAAPAGKAAVIADGDARVAAILAGGGDRAAVDKARIAVWTQAKKAIEEEVKGALSPDGSVAMMSQADAIKSGFSAISQVYGMRGLMVDATGREVPVPVKSNLREGLGPLEYFIGTHGARKGLVDTALKTKESGYLSRRLADVGHAVVVRSEDCGTTEGIAMDADVARVPMRRGPSAAALLARRTPAAPVAIPPFVEGPDATPVAIGRDDRELGAGEAATLAAILAAYPDLSVRLRTPALRARLMGRSLAAPVVTPGEVFAAGSPLDEAAADRLAALIESGVAAPPRVRSPLTCADPRGVCATCYGWDLSTRRRVRVGDPVGIVAAQSIGEPGTQLTLRSFHSGGVAGGADITQGLPRVDELLEVGSPKRRAILAPVGGVVRVRPTVVTVTSPAGDVTAVELDPTLALVVTEDAVVAAGDARAAGDDAAAAPPAPIGGIVSVDAPGDTIAIVIERTHGDDREVAVPATSRLRVRTGDRVEAGDWLTDGAEHPRDVLETRGLAAAWACVVDGVQAVYRSQGVGVADTHVEVIARQLFRRVQVLDPGDGPFVPGETRAREEFATANAALLAQGGTPACARPVVLGMTDAALAVPSFLSAASFQETVRVLADAAIEGRVDYLTGLKEAAIVGALMPAGTGLLDLPGRAASRSTLHKPRLARQVSGPAPAGDGCAAR